MIRNVDASRIVQGHKGTYEGWDLIAEGETEGRGIGRYTSIPDDMFTKVSIPGGGRGGGNARLLPHANEHRSRVQGWREGDHYNPVVPPTASPSGSQVFPPTEMPTPTTPEPTPAPYVDSTPQPINPTAFPTQSPTESLAPIHRSRF